MGMMMDMMTMRLQDTMSMTGTDLSLVEACIEACSACEQACVMCADADAEGDGMGRCAAMNSNCANMCNTMMRMLLRPSGLHKPSLMAMLEAMAMMARACADECSTHAADHEHHRMCAQACMDCMNACEALIGSMKPLAV